MPLSHLATTILAGFSVVSALILLALYWFSLPNMNKTPTSKVVCALMLGGLMGLQVLHVLYFVDSKALLQAREYVVLLMLLPASFYLFSRWALFQDQNANWFDWTQNSLHLLPFAVSFALPAQILPSLGFTLGTFYTLWLATRLYHLRAERTKFAVEIFFFALFAAMAILALILGLLLPLMNPEWFFLFYANCISVAMVCVVAALLMFPDLLEDVAAIAEHAYSQSRLDNIDTRAALGKLERLFSEQHIYKEENIKLGKAAELVGLSPHQLSELINTQTGLSFPRYVKQYRVEAAKQQLLNEPKASMLAVSMDNGFKSQSAFYAAFKEATGLSPGSYRKQAKAS
jgi:AraC-like DNA-binding protein